MRSPRIYDRMKENPCAFEMCFDWYPPVASVDLWYPRQEDSPIKAVDVGLMDVRVADTIRISFDFDRNGYVIRKQEKSDDGTPDVDSPWKEVGFING